MNMKGFTLIETMVAISIIALAVAGPLFSADRAIVAAQNATNQLTALYLAQQGVEYVHAMRDGEYLLAYKTDGGSQSTSADAWTGFLGTPSGSHPGNIYACISPASCTLDVHGYAGTGGTGSGAALAGCTNSCAPLRFNSSLNTFTQNTTTDAPTMFTRTIQASPVNPSEEHITSTVTWTFHNVSYSVTAADNLTSWQ